MSSVFVFICLSLHTLFHFACPSLPLSSRLKRSPSWVIFMYQMTCSSPVWALDQFQHSGVCLNTFLFTNHINHLQPHRPICCRECKQLLCYPNSLNSLHCATWYASYRSIPSMCMSCSIDPSSMLVTTACRTTIATTAGRNSSSRPSFPHYANCSIPLLLITHSLALQECVFASLVCWRRGGGTSVPAGTWNRPVSRPY